MIFPGLLISLCVQYSPQDQHAITEYVNTRDKTEWDLISWEEFENKLKQLYAQRGVLELRGILRR